MNAAEARGPQEVVLPKIKTDSGNQRSPQYRFRSSSKQFVCVELLQDGNHKTFSELFSLLCLDKDQRNSLHPDTSTLRAPLLEEQLEKMETIKLHLSRAEQAERTGSWTAVCEQRLLLGLHFSAPEDVWLALYFFHSCADRKHGGGSRAATEARACLADIYLRRGDLEQARQQGELCLRQAEDGGWLDSSGVSLKLRACLVLGKTYGWLADAQLAASDCDKALKLLHKGHSMSKECDNKLIEAEVVFRFGLTHQSSGDQETAKQFFNTCIEIYNSLQNRDEIVKVLKAMAKSFEKEGNIEETVQCLEKSADICRSSGLPSKLADICLCLGNIYYKTSQYVKAYKCFLQGYEVACEAGDVALLQKAQVMVGCSCALPLIRTYSSDMESASSATVKRLVAWKESRGHQDLITDPAE
ncbi:unnamed protein product [Menidia menidia]|uniref:Tetratricopeptide repeat protein 29 n=1 Tax=Menidia menidia TaxID=238744 RepID=A0A8S4B5A4_9TELE|nr:unnamed protein product [Menidia menidia]